MAAGFGLGVAFAGGASELGRYVEQGELDTFLTQPKSPLLHALGSRWTIRVRYWATVVVLLVFRRFRHLFVFVGATLAVIGINAALVYAFQRPRPYGVEILGDWTGFAHPSQPVAVLTATLLSMLYSLAPQGRPPQFFQFLKRKSEGFALREHQQRMVGGHVIPHLSR